MNGSRIAGLVVVVCLCAVVPAFPQGSLTPPGTPGPTMVTLGQLYSAVGNTLTNIAALQGAIGDVDFDVLTDNLNVLTVALTNLLSISDLLTGSLQTISVNLDGITNAFEGMDWNDIRKIQADVEYCTNVLGTLSGLDEIAIQLGSLSNSLTQITVITNWTGLTYHNTAAMLSAVSNQQAQLDLILAIEEENNAMLRSLTNAPPGGP